MYSGRNFMNFTVTTLGIGAAMTLFIDRSLGSILS